MNLVNKSNNKQLPVVTVFGGSAPKPGEPAYLQAETLGRALARAGLAVATGGYIGVMEAVSKGAAEAGGEAIGVTSDLIESWRPVSPNPYLTRQIRCQSLHARALKLIQIGDALVALPGGVGTLAEVAQTWSYLQTGEISRRPLVLVGELWRTTIEFFLQSADGYFKSTDPELLSFAEDAESAARLVIEFLSRQ